MIKSKKNTPSKKIKFFNGVDKRFTYQEPSEIKEYYKLSQDQYESIDDFMELFQISKKHKNLLFDVVSQIKETKEKNLNESNRKRFKKRS